MVCLPLAGKREKKDMLGGQVLTAEQEEPETERAGMEFPAMQTLRHTKETEMTELLEQLPGIHPLRKPLYTAEAAVLEMLAHKWNRVMAQVMEEMVDKQGIDLVVMDITEQTDLAAAEEAVDLALYKMRPRGTFIISATPAAAGPVASPSVCT